MIDDGLKQFEEVPEGHKSGYVAVVGRPNVGKSTLMNTLLEDKVAIVTPRPQTTRIRQLGILTDNNYQIIFIDTPGIMKPRHKLDEFMVDSANESIVDADMILWLVDASTKPGTFDEKIAKKLATLSEDTPIILGINKNDLLKADQVLPRVSDYQSLLPNSRWILFSALKKKGHDELLEMLIESLPLGPRFYPVDQVTDLYLRDLASELIREQIMLQLRDEIPYGVAVQVLDFKERKNGNTYISANIFVERKNHKQIIIGAKGQKLKKLGAAARTQIEEMMEGKVFLELWVKVEPNWRRNERALRRFGYTTE